MSQYNKQYFTNYHITETEGVVYNDNPLIRATLAGAAAHIVSYVKPTTSLDVGCATGMMVQEMRKRGVMSYGCDVSEYAIDIARSVNRLGKSVWVQDICASPLFGFYDVITMIEVAEHLTEKCGLHAISQICTHTNTVFFSSTADEDRESHINMNEPSYWIDIFARNGFVVDDAFFCPFIPHAMLFRRSGTQ